MKRMIKKKQIYHFTGNTFLLWIYYLNCIIQIERDILWKFNDIST